VARGLHFAVEFAESLGVLSTHDGARCRELLLAYGFPRTPLPVAEELLPFARRDKKGAAGTIHFVVPTAVGACETRPVTPEHLASRLAGG
jgi:3-dehydroquinate synthetase